VYTPFGHSRQVVPTRFVHEREYTQVVHVCAVSESNCTFVSCARHMCTTRVDICTHFYI